jgi:3',5'-nucleoside bisphosphate phosphatase
MLIELQSHSTVSDGQLAPGEVVAQAWEAGVTTLALTDHDAVAGVEEAAEAAKGFGIELVPAIEMSCVHEYAEDLHICGYWVDLGAIGPACERAQKERVNRAEEIIQRLRNWGFEVKLEDAIKEAGDALSIGRPHIARAAGAGPDLGPFFEEYLVPGAKAFVARRWPTAEQAVELIHEAGGAAAVAHPYWDVKDPDGVRDLVVSLEHDVGLEGLESFYPAHTPDQTRHCLALCAELGLAPTASSDYHGPTHKTFSRFGAYDTYGLGEPLVPERP